ncbi:MAG: RluA family pseudouridine synthase [Spirochaetota bacterium]
MDFISELIVPEYADGERIDRFIVSTSDLELSRSFIQKLIRNGDITLNGSSAKASVRIREDQRIRIRIPEPEKLDLLPQDIPLDILYEDPDLLVINKQPGLVVHPGPGNPDSTLVNALLYHVHDLSSIGGVERPGIVHRLDRDTSGVMIVAKTDRAHKGLTAQFADGSIEKYYTAIVSGRLRENPLIIEDPIGRHPKYRQKMTVLPEGRYAKTMVSVRQTWTVHNTVFSRCTVRIYTGRTHQIRVHLSSRGVPVVGDPVYSKNYAKYAVPFLMLAAVKISFTHPVLQKNMAFEAPLPEHMRAFLDKLNDRASQ